MSNYSYSASQNVFLKNDWKQKYISAGTWPSDVVSVSDDIFSEFSAWKLGKVRVAGDDGMPAWKDIPLPTRDELIENVEHERQRLLNYADKITLDWRTELGLGEISDDDRAKLSAWMTYKRSIKTVSCNDAISYGFVWPEPPIE
jgi:hypothetical protein